MRPGLGLLLVALVGCSGDVQSAGGDGDPASPPDPPPGQGGPDAPTSPCRVGLTSSPMNPVTGAAIRVDAQITSLPGVPQLDWRVQLNGAPVVFTVIAGTMVEFVASVPGVYDVDLDITGAPPGCAPDPLAINVFAAEATSALVRLRVVPPPGSGAPAMEKPIVINGGAAMDLGTVSVDRGVSVTQQIRGLEGGGGGYVRFSPQAAPDAIVEAFADSAGRIRASLSPQQHSVLIIPSLAGLAPRRLSGWSPIGGAQLGVGGGALITGTVRDPEDAALAGAQVQVSIDGVPSTLGTTDADGGFALRADPGGGPITVEVTPAAASGLPRLSATSAQLDLGVPLQIRYIMNLGRKDLAGVSVQMRGADTANARVVVVGTLGAAGIVTAGATVTAAGEVRIAATVGPTGVLPRMRVPLASLSAVITTAAGDIAVAALDTTTAVTAIDAPAMQPIATTVMSPTGGSGLAGAVLDVVPLEALAMAGVPALHLTAAAAGAVTMSLPSGGRYELRFRDPFRRGAPLFVADRELATIATSYRLPAVLELRGQVKLGGTQALANAAIQILCSSCSGIERDRPIAEAVSGIAGQFVLAVPDPGTR